LLVYILQVNYFSHPVLLADFRICLALCDITISRLFFVF